MTKEIRFGVLVDAQHLTCPPLQELQHLIRSGRLRRFVSIYGVLPGGDCSTIMAALFADLSAVENLKHRWQWISGDCARIGRHQWLFAPDHGEDSADGWVIDGSHGATRPALVLRNAAHIAMRGATGLRTEAFVRPLATLPGNPLACLPALVNRAVPKVGF
jgi:hypothetical protein